MRRNTLYDPFGNVLTTNGTSASVYGFTGERTDATGLVYLRARYYSSQQGRFFAHDPWGGNAELPGTLHPYHYGLNNPVLYTDPSGRCIGLLSDLARNWDVTKQSCQNYDTALQIVQNDRADLLTKGVAVGVIAGTWVGYGGLQVGGAILGGEAVGGAAALAGAGSAAPIIGACATGGALGVVGQGFADEFTGPSDWTDYAGNAIGGCITGGAAHGISAGVSRVSPYLGRFAGLARGVGNVFAATGGGAASNFAKQSLDNLFDDCPDWSYDTDAIRDEAVAWGVGAGFAELGGYGLRASARLLANAFRPNTVAALQILATQAEAKVGQYGPVAGTLKHSEFQRLVNALNRSDLTTEVNYLNGVVIRSNSAGSVRLDVVEGPLDAPIAVYDLKTGSASLDAARIRQIRSHLPNGGMSKNGNPIPIIEIRP